MSPAHLVLPLLFYSGLNYGDYRSSVSATNRGGIELNPAVRTLGLGKTKAVSAILETAVDVWLQKDKHKATVWTYRITIAVILGGVMINNNRVNRIRK